MGEDKHEPTFVQFMRNTEYEKCKGILEEKGWMTILWKFQGYNDQVAMAFAQSFNGEHAQINNLNFNVTEESVS